MKIQTISFFAQILKDIPRLEFNNIVQKHQADRFSKRFTAWDQFIAMLGVNLAVRNHCVK